MPADRDHAGPVPAPLFRARQADLLARSVTGSNLRKLVAGGGFESPKAKPTVSQTALRLVANVDQQMMVEQQAPATYWAMLWNWQGASYGRYLGLQTNGNRLDGTTGDTALFSLWDANAASGPNCGNFGGEGSGYSCRLAYPIATNRYYRYRIWRGSADAGGAARPRSASVGRPAYE